MTEPVQSSDELRESRARIVASSNHARRALERRLHDGPQQHLVSMAVKLTLIESAVDESPDEAKAMIDELRGEVQETVAQLRDIASAIFPPLLTDRGLAEALRGAAARESSTATIDVDGSAVGRYPLEVEAGIYFAVVDAMHMATGELAVSVREAGDRLVLTLAGGLPEDVFVHVEDRVHTVGGQSFRRGDDIVAEIPIGEVG